MVFTSEQTAEIGFPCDAYLTNGLQLKAQAKKISGKVWPEAYDEKIEIVHKLFFVPDYFSEQYHQNYDFFNSLLRVLKNDEN